MRLSRMAWLAACFVVLSLFASACGSGSAETVASGAAQQGQVPTPAPEKGDDGTTGEISDIERFDGQIPPGVTPVPDFENVRRPAEGLEVPIEKQDIGNGESVPCYGDRPGTISDWFVPEPAERVIASQDKVTYWAVVTPQSYDPADQRYDLNEVVVAIGKDEGDLATAPRAAYESSGLGHSLFEAGYSSLLIGVASDGATVGRAVPTADGGWEMVFACSSNFAVNIADAVRSTLGTRGESIAPSERSTATMEILGFAGLEASVKSRRGQGSEFSSAVLSQLRTTDVAGTPEVKWGDLGPDQRSAYDAPPEVQERLDQVQLRIYVPDNWLGSDQGTLCARTPLAWSGCVSLDLEWGDNPNDNRFLPLPVLKDAGDPIELMLLPVEAQRNGPLQVLTTIPGGAVTDSQQIDVVIEATATASETLREASKPEIAIGEGEG